MTDGGNCNIPISFKKGVGIINASCSRTQSSDSCEGRTCRHSWGKCWARVYTCTPKDYHCLVKDIDY